MAFGGANTGGFIRLAPLARSVSPRYGILRGIGSTNSTIPRPRGIKAPRPGASITGAPNIKSPFGKGSTINKLRK